MNEKFDSWNEIKKHIHMRKRVPFSYEREVWWCSLGKNVGYEQNGDDDQYRRPVLILKFFSSHTCLVVPLTSSTKTHKLRPSAGVVNGKDARCLISQIKVIDTKRLTEKIGYIDKLIYEDIRKTVKEIL